jgi:hypothetical protein
MKYTAVKVSSAHEYSKKYVLSMPTFDNTKLVNLNTCPRYGLIRYEHHKTMGGTGRAMALEAGHAAHEVFAAHRLYTLLHMDPKNKLNLDRYDAIVQHGQSLFPDGRYEEMCKAINSAEDHRTNMMKFSLTALYNSGFYDEPGDTRKSMTEIENTCIMYMDRFDWSDELPVVINREGGYFIGIEVPVDVVVTFYTEADGTIEIRFIGKVDGVHVMDNGGLRVHENKTASRLGAAWIDSWETNNQPTGYMIAISAMLSEPVRNAMMLGSCLPMPRSNAVGSGLERVPVKRKDWQLQGWFDWLLHTYELWARYKDDPTNAPMYTHSCNRYFRSCSFQMLCSMDPTERLAMFNEMPRDKWTPLEDERDAEKSSDAPL